jgi:hypothetical protein
MMLGYVDRVDDHVIATKFEFLLIPTGSMYVTGESSERHGNRTTFSWSGVPILFNWKSAALAYPRVWLWFLAFAWPFLTHYGENVDSMTWKDWMAPLGMVVAAILSQFLGRLPEREKKRLRVLGSVTGLRIDPSKLNRFTRETKRQIMEDAFTKAGMPIEADACEKLAATAPAEELPLLYAFTRYSGDGPAWRAASSAVLARLDSAGAAA